MIVRERRGAVLSRGREDRTEEGTEQNRIEQKKEHKRTEEGTKENRRGNRREEMGRELRRLALNPRWSSVQLLCTCMNATA